MQFRAASKGAAKLRLALAGPAGSGKTYSALAIASHLGVPVAVVDTERGSASKYADLFRFDVLELQSFHPERYIEAIHAAEQAGYAVVVLDSLSHAWMGKDGALELVDRAQKRSQSSNSFAAWRDVTPLHNALVDAMLAANLHLIITMRSKTEYVQERDDRGKTIIRKVGLAPVQRDGLEYEFDVYGDLDQDNNLIVGKTRCSALAGQVIHKPGAQIADVLKQWLGTPAAAPPVENRSNGHSTEADPGQPPQSRATDLVTSADDRVWKRWEQIRKQALDLGLRVEELRLPLPRAQFVTAGVQLSAAIAGRKAQLAHEDAERAAGETARSESGPPPLPDSESLGRAGTDASPAAESARRPTRLELWARNRELCNKAVELGVAGRDDMLNNRSTDDVIAQANADLELRIEKAESSLVQDAATP